MLACIQSVPEHPIVQIQGCGDEDRLNVALVKQLAVVGVRRGCTIKKIAGLGEIRLVDVAQGHTAADVDMLQMSFEEPLAATAWSDQAVVDDPTRGPGGKNDGSRLDWWNDGRRRGRHPRRLNEIPSADVLFLSHELAP